MPGASSLIIDSRTGAYEVDVADGAFAALLASRPDALLIVDERFVRDPTFVGRRLLAAVADEEHKTLREVERLLVALRELGAGRSDELIAVGGGIVQDVATQTAQLYMRGLPWSYVPTTLLGMADSCIGGKSSINAGPFKNLVGSFYPPRGVVVDPRFLRTLPDEAIAAGLAEAMKISYCRGRPSFERHLALQERFEADPGALIHHSLDTKRWFIETDEFDAGARRLLNFGHTFGHALEAATGFAVSHGIAVALGVLSAEHFGVQTGYGTADEDLRGHFGALARRGGDLRTVVERFDPASFDRAFLADKKHRADGLSLILPVRSGGVAEVPVPKTDAVVATARASIVHSLATVAP